MFCPNCGKQLPDNSKFCSGCGKPVTPLSGSGLKTAPPKAPKPPKPQKEPKEGGNKTVLILGIIIAVLVIAGAGAGIFYVTAVRNEAEADDEDDIRGEDEEETAEDDEEASTEQEEEEMPEQEAAEQAIPEQEEPVEEAVVSDVYEVVGDQILENIPKAVYSYRFDGSLDGAEVVMRKQPETEPEPADSARAQYTRGMDGDAVWLDGTYGLKLSNVEKLEGPYTVAFWMKAEELYDWSPFIHIGKNLLDQDARYRVWIGQKPDGNGGSRGPILSSEQVSKKYAAEIVPEKAAVPDLTEGVWYHIAFTVYGTQDGWVGGTLYLDGAPVGTGDMVLKGLNGDDFSIYLGINCWDDLYPVAFDDVKIWDHALADEQIAELCAAYE